MSKANSAYVQAATFGAYFVMGLPAGWFMKRFGYQKGVILGLGLYAAGAFLMVPAANAASFTFLLVALFVLACGLGTLEAVAHPFLDGLGDPASSDRRITFSHAINGIGAVSGPLIGGYFVLRGTHAAGDLSSVKVLYTIIGTVVGSIGLLFAFVKVPPLNAEHTPGTATSETGDAPTDLAADKSLFQHKHFVWACVAQLFNTAAQGGTWAFFINYGTDYMALQPGPAIHGFWQVGTLISRTVALGPGLPHLANDVAAYFFSLSLVGMMLGRFLGTYLMQYIAPNRLLAFAALAQHRPVPRGGAARGLGIVRGPHRAQLLLQRHVPDYLQPGAEGLGPPQAAGLVVHCDGRGGRGAVSALRDGARGQRQRGPRLLPAHHLLRGGVFVRGEVVQSGAGLGAQPAQCQRGRTF